MRLHPFSAWRVLFHIFVFNKEKMKLKLFKLSWKIKDLKTFPDEEKNPLSLLESLSVSPESFSLSLLLVEFASHEPKPVKPPRPPPRPPPSPPLSPLSSAKKQRSTLNSEHRRPRADRTEQSTVVLGLLTRAGAGKFERKKQRNSSKRKEKLPFVSDCEGLQRKNHCIHFRLSKQVS